MVRGSKTKISPFCASAVPAPFLGAWSQSLTASIGSTIRLPGASGPHTWLSPDCNGNARITRFGTSQQTSGDPSKIGHSEADAGPGRF
jgi:hypothetical protein